MKVSILIPARYQSSRFPGKPLATILDRPMIQWVYEQASKSTLASEVVVATDDQRIADAVAAFGGRSVMTSPEHPSGTDRIAEAAAALDSDILVNVQGDEPLIDPVAIDAAIRPLLEDQRVGMSTLAAPIASYDDFINPNIVKVVVGDRSDALYFSRAPVPFPRDLPAGAVPPQALRHIGLYCYRRDFLFQVAALTPTPGEQTEKLEQLRVLEHGFPIRVGLTDHAGQGVDTPEDIAIILRMLRDRQS